MRIVITTGGIVDLAEGIIDDTCLVIIQFLIFPQQEKATKAEMAHISAETKELLIQNMPEVLNNLVGQQAAVIGTIKVFETFQNVTLNKQLFYDSLELCLQELFPELHEKSEPAFLAKTM